jgi:hypothetical protein
MNVFGIYELMKHIGQYSWDPRPLHIVCGMTYFNPEDCWYRLNELEFRQFNKHQVVFIRYIIRKMSRVYNDFDHIECLKLINQHAIPPLFGCRSDTPFYHGVPDPHWNVLISCHSLYCLRKKSFEQDVADWLAKTSMGEKWNFSYTRRTLISESFSYDSDDSYESDYLYESDYSHESD